jgi:hypothetical protein
MVTSKDDKELIVQAYLLEYDKFRDEIIHYLNIQTQIPIWTMGAGVVVIPIILTQASVLPVPIVISVMLSLVIFFSCMSMIYAGSTYSMHHVAAHIRDHIEPKINNLIGNNEHQVFRWERTAFLDRKKFFVLLLDTISSIGVNVILLLPGSLFLVLINSHYYYQLFSSLSNQPNYFWLSIYQYFAIGIFILSVISLVSLAYYAMIIAVPKMKFWEKHMWEDRNVQ